VANSSTSANTMQASLAQLVSEKEAMQSEHQANTAFLNQQLSKLTASNELKNN
jgi:outer membrane murein-binding lipoprotein Lpp